MPLATVKVNGARRPEMGRTGACVSRDAAMRVMGPGNDRGAGHLFHTNRHNAPEDLLGAEVVTMNWNTVRIASHGHRAAGALLLVPILLVGPVEAREAYPLPGYYAGGLTAESGWDQILKARGVQPQWPELSFGSTLVPI